LRPPSFLILFFNDTATTDISPLSLHDALPIFFVEPLPLGGQARDFGLLIFGRRLALGIGPVHPAQLLVRKIGHDLDPLPPFGARSEEHTSELQSLTNLVCRLLLEKNKIRNLYA